MPSFLARVRGVLACGLVSVVLLGGCASTGNPRDPFEPINRGIYQFNEGVDNLVVKPAAEIYRSVTPQIVRTGVSNFFSNIGDVIVALNNLLQGKFTQAVSDVGRIAVNTTAGLFGIFDVATEIGLEKHNEDFGQTLGWWGVGDGPYIVLPFLGPSNLRDSVGLFVDIRTDPLTYVDPTRDRNVLWGFRALSRRAELLETSRILETAALDPYDFLRDAYFQRRRNLVFDGNPPPEKDEDMDIPMKPKPSSGSRDASTFPSDDGTPPSVVFTRELETPAEVKAREREATPAARREPRAERRESRHVRVWLPQR